MIKLSVNETKWSSLLARTRALILYISIWKFDFGPEMLPGLSRNGRQVYNWESRHHSLVCRCGPADILYQWKIACLFYLKARHCKEGGLLALRFVGMREPYFAFPLTHKHSHSSCAGFITQLKCSLLLEVIFTIYLTHKSRKFMNK